MSAKELATWAVAEILVVTGIVVVVAYSLSLAWAAGELVRALRRWYR